MKQTSVTLLVLLLSLLTASLAVEAQPTGKPVRLGLLYSSSPAFNPQADPFDKAFAEGLRENGYVVGQHLVIEFRSALGKPDRFPALAAELVGLPADVIIAISTRAAQAAKQATSTIPIVMMASDPVERGLVASLARPGGNVTGLTNNPGSGWDSKMLQLLKEAAPRASRVAIVHSGDPPELGMLRGLETLSQAFGVTILSAEIRDPDGLANSFAVIARQHADALLVTPSPLNFRFLKPIVEFAITNRLPAMFGDRAFVEAGGLMSYWTSWNDLARRAAYYVAKILRGAKPADLPVEEPSKFELVINMKTAKMIGLTIPPSVLARADEVIE
jgi:putative ABC transport system substrate-binding protein